MHTLSSTLADLRASLMALIVFTLLLGGAYPGLVGLAGALFFPQQAQGSPIEDASGLRGAALVGQDFHSPHYLWGRPSVTSPAYNGAASAASNLGPTNPALLDAVKARVAAMRAAHPDPGPLARVPVELVTSSGSGLDPHLSPAAALWQAARVAQARGVDAARIRALIEARIEPPGLGLLGQARVNVLALNRELDRVYPLPVPAAPPR